MRPINCLPNAVPSSVCRQTVSTTAVRRMYGVLYQLVEAERRSYGLFCFDSLTYFTPSTSSGRPSGCDVSSDVVVVWTVVEIRVESGRKWLQR